MSQAPEAELRERAGSADETSSLETPLETGEENARLFLETPKGSVVLSFKAAFAGVARCVASQRNMKLHVLSALMVMIVGMALPLDLATRVALVFAVSVVFFAEILNTGLEALVDLYIGEYHRLAMLAKDAAAGGVLVLASATVLILAEILWQRWDLVTDNLDAVWRSVRFGVPLVVVEAIGLFWLRRGPLALVRVAVAGALLFPLVTHSKDPIYSGVAFALVVVAALSRYSFPSRTGRGAPPRPSALSSSGNPSTVPER